MKLDVGIFQPSTRVIKQELEVFQTFTTSYEAGVGVFQPSTRVMQQEV
jgi:hypothetical protein